MVMAATRKSTATIIDFRVLARDAVETWSHHMNKRDRKSDIFAIQTVNK